MELKELFEMQRKLDEHIIKEKALEGQDLVSNTMLALHVELGEMANEWQGFKYWRTNSQPKPNLLKEYIDCLHFFLSIAIQKGWEDAMYIYEDAILELEEKGLEGGVTGATLEIIYHLSRALEKPKEEKILGRETNEYSFSLAWFVFVALGLVGFKFTEEQIVQAYKEKNQVNHKRQENGY